MDEETVRSEIVKVNSLIKEKIGYDIRWLRPGELAVDDTVYKVATELNMPIIGAGCDAKDYTDIDADSIKSNILNGAADGQIVLMHADKTKTAESFEEVVSTLYSQGYRFVTLSELFAIKGTGVIPTNTRIRNSACEGY